MKFVERTYRNFRATERFTPFQVSWKETDLYIKARTNLAEKAKEAILLYRGQIEAYIRKKPQFKTSLEPLESDPEAVPIIHDMLQATQITGVGPMASVAGAIAEYVGRNLLPLSSEVIVENGGDIFLVVEDPVVVGLFAGDSPYTNQIGIRITPEDTPCGFCTSSGTVGPSLSFGKADAASIWAVSATLADAAATAIGNLVKQQEDIEYALEKATQIPGIKGVIIAIQERIGIWGPMDIIQLED
jgi:hypothetical protein